MSAGRLFAEDEDDSEFTAKLSSRSNFELDGMTLDEIIRVKRKRGPNDPVGFDGIPSGEEIQDALELPAETKTPLQVLHGLSQGGYQFIVEFKELWQLDDDGSRGIRWRAEWTELKTKTDGVGVGGRKQMAKQAGALDILNRMKLKLPNLAFGIPRIPVGCRISPFVFDMLTRAVKNADAYYDFDMHVRQCNNKKIYTSICSIDDDSFSGESASSAYAQRFAALRAYERLSGNQFELDPIICGDECPKDNAPYKAVESEANTVFNVFGGMKKPLKISKPFAAAGCSRNSRSLKRASSASSDKSSIPDSDMYREETQFTDDPSDSDAGIDKLDSEGEDDYDDLDLEAELAKMPSAEVYDISVFDELDDTDTEELVPRKTYRMLKLSEITFESDEEDEEWVDVDDDDDEWVDIEDDEDERLDVKNEVDVKETVAVVEDAGAGWLGLDVVDADDEAWIDVNDDIKMEGKD